MTGKERRRGDEKDVNFCCCSAISYDHTCRAGSAGCNCESLVSVELEGGHHLHNDRRHDSEAADCCRDVAQGGIVNVSDSAERKR